MFILLENTNPRLFYLLEQSLYCLVSFKNGKYVGESYPKQISIKWAFLFCQRLFGIRREASAASTKKYFNR